MRALGLFWAVILAVLTIGAVTLQVLGPPAPKSPLSGMSAPRPAAEAPAAPPPLTPSPVAAAAPLIPEADPGLLEPAADFPDQNLPRIGADGRKPSSVYAAPMDPNEKRPRIGFIIDGIGLDGPLSHRAMTSLPPAIDFAISNYAPSAQAADLAQAGRTQGRECLVSIPMEPAGAPAADEGEHALLTGAEGDSNRWNLENALAHVAGCVGGTGASDGLSGERYAASPELMSDLLTQLSQRGLIYVDPRPGATPPPELGGDVLPPRVVDVVADASTGPEAPATAADIDAKLAQLTQLAKLHGAAIGLAGPPTPMLLDRLAIWANSLAAQGVVLAPITALPQPPPQPPAASPATPADVPPPPTGPKALDGTLIPG